MEAPALPMVGILAETYLNDGVGMWKNRYMLRING
jgi:hypothetical protein